MAHRYFYHALIALIFCVGIAVQCITQACPDVAWLLLVAHRMLQGQVLYRDIIEPAPPLILWLYSLPVMVSGWVNLAPSLLLKFGTTALVAVDIFLCARILKHSQLWQGCRMPMLLGIAGILLLLPNNFVVFAQREYLLVLFTLPYLLSRLPTIAREAFSPAANIGLGLWAAIGFCIKPYFFIIWLVLLAYQLGRYKNIRALLGAGEWTIGIATLFYLAAIWHFTPDYFEWLKILAPNYAYYEIPSATTLGIAFWFLGLGAIGVALGWGMGVFRMEADALYKRDTFYLLCIAAGAYAQALCQFKGWDYIAYPFQAFGVLALLPIIILKPVNHLLAIALMAWVFYPSLPIADNAQDEQKKSDAELMKILEPYRQSPDLYLIQGYMPSAPLFKTQAPLEWKNKFNSLNFLLFGIMERSDITGSPILKVRAGKEWQEQWLLDAIADDLAKKHPHLLVLSQNSNAQYGDAAYLDLQRWFARNKRLMRVLADYTLASEVKQCHKMDATCHRYQIYLHRE